MRYQLLQGCSFILAQLYDILFHGVLLDSFFLTPQGYPFSLLSSILLGQTTRYQPWLWQDAGSQFRDQQKTRSTGEAVKRYQALGFGSTRAFEQSLGALSTPVERNEGAGRGALSRPR